MAHILALVLVLFAGACYAAPGRIVGGMPTTIEEYTSMAQVEFQGVVTGAWSQSCACSILNSRHVLSAAHCFSGLFYTVARRRIRAGATFRNTGGVVNNAEEEFNHPSYGQQGYDGDLSVVRLVNPLVYSAVIQQAVIIAQDFTIPAGVPVVQAGWGATAAGGAASEQLRDVTTYTISNDICRDLYAPENRIVTTNMVCTGILGVGGMGACQADSGGPVYFGNIVIGVVSWSIDCADPFFPGVNTALWPYTNWIIGITES